MVGDHAVLVLSPCRFPHPLSAGSLARLVGPSGFVSPGGMHLIYRGGSDSSTPFFIPGRFLCFGDLLDNHTVDDVPHLATGANLRDGIRGHAAITCVFRTMWFGPSGMPVPDRQ